MHIADFLVKQIPELLIVVAVFSGDEDAVVVHLGHPSLPQFFVGDVALGGWRQIVGVFLLPCVGIGLVEDDDGLLIGSIGAMVEASTLGKSIIPTPASKARCMASLRSRLNWWS